MGPAFLEQMPLGRWATQDEIAAPIGFLLSDDASMITGVTLPIDGGYTCRSVHGCMWAPPLRTLSTTLRPAYTAMPTRSR